MASSTKRSRTEPDVLGVSFKTQNGLHRSAVSYTTGFDKWLSCIQEWYPYLHERTYFLPPLHFNRVPYVVETVAGQSVLVPSVAQGHPIVSSPPRASKATTIKDDATNCSQNSSTCQSDITRLSPTYCTHNSTYSLNEPSLSQICMTNPASIYTSGFPLNSLGDPPPAHSHPVQTFTPHFLIPAHSGSVLYSKPSWTLSAQNSPNESQSSPISTFKLWPDQPATITSVKDSDVRDDNAVHRVLCCLRALAKVRREVMFVISQLQFGKYINKPSYTAAATVSYPKIKDLPKVDRRGDFDVLIIHSRYGLITGDIKSVGANFNSLGLTTGKEDSNVLKAVRKALKQLKKAENVLSHLVSDIGGIQITKTLILANISTKQLERAIESDQNLQKDLCQCLGTQNITDAIELCLLSDNLSEITTPWEVTDAILNGLGEWWENLVTSFDVRTPLTPEVYRELISRFCGPATTVEIHCITSPRLELRTEGEGVSETGERMARLVLFPEQVDILNASLPKVFLIGPPGTGKTVVIILKGLSWLQHGYDVTVLSPWSDSRAAAYVIEFQMRQTFIAWGRETVGASPDPQVHRIMYDFKKKSDVENALRHLRLNTAHPPHILADEAGSIDSRNFSVFCGELNKQIHSLHLWAATVHNSSDNQIAIQDILLHVSMTTPLRSPPVVIREVAQAEEILYGNVPKYTDSKVPVPTDGPEIRRITHNQFDGHLKHLGESPQDCEECGHQISRILEELNVGRIVPGLSEGSPVLRFRDVFILCDLPRDVRRDSNGQEHPGIGLVHGLRDCHIPVRVVEGGDEYAIRDTALALYDVVTVARWEDTCGLERKVVVVVDGKDAETQRYCHDVIHAVSRCSSLLVLVECRKDYVCKEIC